MKRRMKGLFEAGSLTIDVAKAQDQMEIELQEPSQLQAA